MVFFLKKNILIPNVTEKNDDLCDIFDLGTDHLTCRGGYGFLFRSEFFFPTTQELELFFFVTQSTNFFFQNLTLGYMTKTLNQIIFFPPPKSEYFFQQHWESEYFFLEKKP
jgi:hypothetical protein